MSEFLSDSVENTILNLLAASEINFEYPALQKDAADIISTNLSDCIYSTLEQKSVASSNKRCNLLKFLNNICQTPESHLSKDHYKIYLKAYEREFYKTNCPEAEDLVRVISKELDSMSLDVHRTVSDFYKRKNSKRKVRIKKQEIIKQLDREKLSNSLGMNFSRNISYYETSQSLIDDFLKEPKKSSITNHISVEFNSRRFREKQAKFCYALINIGADDSDMKLLENILQRYLGYVLLEAFEINLLIDMWLVGEHQNMDLAKIVIEKFPFVIEKLILEFCTDILNLREHSEVDNYFSILNTNPKIVRLRDVCNKNFSFYCKLKCLIFELYVFSYCNENIYKLSDYII